MFDYIQSGFSTLAGTKNNRHQQQVVRLFSLTNAFLAWAGHVLVALFLVSVPAPRLLPIGRLQAHVRLILQVVLPTVIPVSFYVAVELHRHLK